MDNGTDVSIELRCDAREAAGTIEENLPKKIINDSDVLKFIANIDMTLLKESVKDRLGWSIAQVEAAEQRYKKWLFLRRKYPGELMPPTGDIDAIWHAHILDTIAYFRDTAAIFGVYFHHFPYFGIRGEDDKKRVLKAFENTKSRWLVEYGEVLIGEVRR